MGLETGTYIDDLNASNPVHATDQVSQGDDHIRLIKSTILATFPNITGAMTATHTELNYLDGVTGTTGTGNAVLSASPTLTGTITAAAANLSGALTAASYGGITEANLVDKTASETISGATWDFQAVTAVSFGGIASGNLVDKSTTETISGVWTYSAIPVMTNGVNVGSTSTTVTEEAAGHIAVEGQTVAQHGTGQTNANYSSADIFMSTSAASGGAAGDIWFQYTA